MTYRFTISLDSMDYSFAFGESDINKYLKVAIPKKYNGPFHTQEKIGLNIRLYERNRSYIEDTPIITTASLTHLARRIQKSLFMIAYQSMNQVVDIKVSRFAGSKKKIEIEVIEYEE